MRMSLSKAPVLGIHIGSAADVKSLVENIDVLFFESAMPDEVLLRHCYRTPCSRDSTFQIEGRSCHVYEIGSRRSEREKWWNYFQDVDTIIFVVSLTGYCQTLVENVNAISTNGAYFTLQRRATPPQNRMQESLILFESTSKLDSFKTVPIILMLNKMDLLEQRMKDDPIAEYYPEYSGDSDPITACRFFAGKFSQLDRRLPGYLRILVTSAVKQDDEFFNFKIDEL